MGRSGPPPGVGDVHQIGAKTREWMVHRSECAAFANLGINLAGRSEAVAGFSFVRRDPPMAQALLCDGGRGRVWVDGAWAACGAGMAYLTPAGVPHAYQALAGEPWQVIWVMVAAKPGKISPYSLVQPVLAAVDPRPLGEAVRGIYREIGHQTGTGAGAGAAHLYAALIEVLVQRLFHPWQGDRRLTALWEEVDGDLAHPWDAESLAARAGLAPEQLRRRCVKTCGQSPMRRVTAMRMRRAATLLGSSGEAVETIAGMVGYRNAFAFSTAFRRVIGHAPSALRRSGGT